MSEYKEVFKRAEIKYLLSAGQYERLMPYLERIAGIDAYGLSKINNIYFDTPDFRLIRASLDKPLYKEKLRLRTYGDTTGETNSFIEIKKKYDGIVYKRRISGRYADTYACLTDRTRAVEDSQVGREIRSFLQTYENLRPAMRIHYDRIAMAGLQDPDFRVTFDTNIRWDTGVLDLSAADTGKPILAPGQILMEIKVANAIPLELSGKLSEWNIFPVSFSKYGRGYTDMISPDAESRAHRGEIINYGWNRERIMRKGVAAYV